MRTSLAEMAPINGWLTKEGGRSAEGLFKMFSRNKKRWFVLTMPEEDFEATFRYYDSPPRPCAPAPRPAPSPTRTRAR